MFTLYNMFLIDKDGVTHDLCPVLQEADIDLSDASQVEAGIKEIRDDFPNSSLRCFGATPTWYYAYGCFSIGDEKLAVKLYPSHSGYDTTTKPCVLDASDNWIQANQRGKSAHVHGKMLGRVVVAADKAYNGGLDFESVLHNMPLGSSSGGSIKAAPKALNTLNVQSKLLNRLKKLKK